MVDGRRDKGGLSLPQHRQHEHGSDDERSVYSDDEEFARHSIARRHSFSDAADDTSIDLPHRRLAHYGSDHEADSMFRMQELHHRHPPSGLAAHHHSPHPIHPTHSSDSTSSHRYANGRPRPPQHKALTARNRKRKWTVWLRLSVLSGIVGYFVLVILGSQVLQKHDETVVDHPLLPRSENAYIGSGTHFTRDRLEKERHYLKLDTEKLIEQRADERRRRTTPPPLTTPIPRTPQRVADSSSSTEPPQEDAASSLASLEDLCGVHARNASLVNPNSYLARNALTPDSRVLITGILNPVGFHLALALQEKCKVQVMFGIDPMYPNTVEHRLELQSRIHLLTTRLPKLVQPIVLPFVGLDPRLNKQKTKNLPALLRTTGELNLLNFNPTHIVHLATYSPEEFIDRRHPEFRNLQSPYVTEERHAPLYRIRSNLASMEQLLSSLASVESQEERPHFTYASSGTSHPDPVHRFTKQADEMLADTYRALHGVASVGLRLPDSIYGPWGRPGTPFYELAETAVEHWTASPASRNGRLLEAANLTDSQHQLAYVDDIVDAIIASMQVRPEGSAAAVLDASSVSTHSLSSVASLVESFLPKSQTHVDSVPVATDPLMQETERLLQWRPTTSLREGMIRMLAWHLDQKHPYGDPTRSIETGDAFLERQKAPTCAMDDVMCHGGRHVLPCESECSTKSQCAPSAFDPVADLIRNVTADCDIVLYTQSIGYDVKALLLSATHMEEGRQLICNFAFIPRESTLVSNVIDKVPDKQLSKFGISLSKASKSEIQERKLDGLNGRLLYKGWILLWVPGMTKPVSTADKFLLKLSPGRLFSSDVKRALFVDEKFPVSPNIDDVQFLVSQSQRGALKTRVIYHKEHDGSKTKFKLGAEPERRAAILLAPLKTRASADEKEQALIDGQKLSVYNAVKYMRFEIGENAATSKESPLVKKQREYYERVPTFANRQDMRSNLEPWYRYNMKHWIRSRWIVHDLTLEESRQLRCDWYSHHVPWNNDLDQLSFAHVMAQRELERRVAQNEPDDHVKPAHVENPILKQLTDAHEWHAIIGHDAHIVSADDALFQLPAHLDTPATKTEPPAKLKQRNAPLFVRIMSERIMLLSRRAWQESRKPLYKKKKVIKKKK